MARNNKKDVIPGNIPTPRVSISERAKGFVAVAEDEYGHSILKVGDALIQVHDGFDVEGIREDVIASMKRFGFRVRRAALNTVVRKAKEIQVRERGGGISGIIRSAVVDDVIRKVAPHVQTEPSPATTFPPPTDLNEDAPETDHEEQPAADGE